MQIHQTQLNWNKHYSYWQIYLYRTFLLIRGVKKWGNKKGKIILIKKIKLHLHKLL